MAETTPQKPAKRPRRDKRSAANRQKLLTSTLELVVESGVAAATMVAITKRAGLHPPAFYVHFKNVDECIAASARHIWEREREVSASLRASVAAGTTASSRDEIELAVIERSLQGIVDNAQIYEVLLRRLHDTGPIGDVARDQRETVCRELTEYLWRLAIAAGVEAGHLLELQATARHLVNLYFAAATDLIEGRSKDVVAEAKRIDRYSRTIAQTEMQRMLETP